MASFHPTHIRSTMEHPRGGLSATGKTGSEGEEGQRERDQEESELPDKIQSGNALEGHAG